MLARGGVRGADGTPGTELKIWNPGGVTGSAAPPGLIHTSLSSRGCARLRLASPLANICRPSGAKTGADRLHDSQVVPHAHRTEPHIHVGGHDGEQAHPCPQHVPFVQRRATLVERAT